MLLLVETGLAGTWFRLDPWTRAQPILFVPLDSHLFADSCFRRPFHITRQKPSRPVHSRVLDPVLRCLAAHRS